jgi:hypothetical protein
LLSSPHPEKRDSHPNCFVLRCHSHCSLHFNFCAQKPSQF